MNQIVSNEGTKWVAKPNLLKSTLEIIFATVFIPIVVVAITTFTTNDFALFNLMNPLYWSGGMIDKLVLIFGGITTILYILLYCTLILDCL